MAKAKKDKAEEEPKEAAGEASAAEGGEASAEGAPTAEGEAADGGGKKKIILIGAGVFLLLVVIGAGLYFTGMLDGLLGKTDAAEGAAEAGGGHEEAKKGDHGEAKKGGHGEKKGGGGHGAEAAGGGSFVAIPTMIVNLNSDDGTPRYLRLTVQLELADESDKSAVEAIIPKVIDQFQTYLRELRVRDLRGSGGIYRLQMELLWRVNQAAAPAEVKDVLFQEILIQ